MALNASAMSVRLIPVRPADVREIVFASNRDRSKSFCCRSTSVLDRGGQSQRRASSGREYY